MKTILKLLVTIIFLQPILKSVNPTSMLDVFNQIKIEPIKSHLNESHHNIKKSINVLTNNTKKNITSDPNKMPKGDYLKSCKFCTCDLDKNLLSCSDCVDDRKSTKNLSYPGICSNSQNISYINNYLTPTSGFLYEYLKIIETVKQQLETNPDNSVNKLSVYEDKVAAYLINNLKFFQKYQFPLIHSMNSTPLIRVNSLKQKKREKVNLPMNYIDFSAEKELPCKDGNCKIKDEDYITDETLSSIMNFVEDITTSLAEKKDDSQDSDSYLDAATGFGDNDDSSDKSQSTTTEI